MSFFSGFISAILLLAREEEADRYGVILVLVGLGELGGWG